jgi:hypothetical protein
MADEKNMSSTPDYSADTEYSPILKPRDPQDPEEELQEYSLMINGLPHDVLMTKADAELYGAKPKPKKVAKVVQPPAKRQPAKGARATGKSQ